MDNKNFKDTLIGFRTILERIGKKIEMSERLEIEKAE